jgi:hypothetical protein
MRIRSIPISCLLLAALGCGGGPADGADAGVVITLPSGHRLGGTATGIPASGLTLIDAIAGRVTLAQDGPFWFERRLPTGAPYAVSIEGLVVPGRYCSLSNVAGTMPTADLSTIVVNCQVVVPPPGG